MKTKQFFIVSFILLVLQALTLVSSCGSLKKHKTETSEKQSSQFLQSDQAVQTIVDSWKEIQDEWLHEFEFKSANISRDTVILSKLSTKKGGNKIIRTQAHEENKLTEQIVQEQTKEEKSHIRSDKEKEPPRSLLWISLIPLIIIALAWVLKRT